MSEEAARSSGAAGAPRYWRCGEELAAGAAAPSVDAFGPLALWGEGVFDTLRVEAGRPLFVHHHRARTLQSAESIWGANATRDRHLEGAYRWLCERAAGANLNCARARVLVAPIGSSAADFDVFAQLLPAEPPIGLAPASGLRVGFSRLQHPGFLSWGKTTSAIWSRLVAREASQRGLDELLVGNEGIWLEAGWSSLVWRLHGVWFAVDTDEGVLASTTLAALEECGEVFHRALPDRAELLSAECVVLLNSWGLARGVAELDTRSFVDPDGEPLRFRRLLLEAHARGA